jgi:hypothetical protein
MIISLLGVDGVGKTTLLEQLRAPDVLTLRMPQFYLSSAAWPFAAEARCLEQIGQQADVVGDAKTKALSLFMAFLPFSSVLAAAHKTGMKIFVERHPWVDIFVYADFYVSLLKQLEGIEAHKDLEPQFEKFKSNQLLPVDLQWLNFSNWIIGGLSGSDAERFQFLQTVFPDCQVDLFVLLTAGAETLEKRLKMKHQGGRVREPHEQIQLMMRLQTGLLQTLNALKLPYQELPTDGSSPVEVCKQMEAQF